MTDTLNKFLIFTAGVVIGSAVTWKLVKTKYEQIAREEIESVKERYSNRVNAATVDTVEVTTKHEPIDEYKDEFDEVKEEYNQIVQRYTKPKSDTSEPDEPYVIPPEEFGEKDDYECVSLIYFADNVLADECYEPVPSINATVGRDALNSFGEFEDDAVHVRNDNLKKDYEILLDSRNYSEVVNNGPQLTED